LRGELGDDAPLPSPGFQREASRATFFAVGSFTDSRCVRMKTAPFPPVRIAMWSGPRNVSTALLRSWGNRPDTVVCDEPFYGHYLLVTGAPHPGAERVIASQETDWRRVAETLPGALPAGKRPFYQKHMARHLVDGMEGEWLDALEHGFLMRHPRDMLASLDAKLPRPKLLDTGLPQQVRLFRRVTNATGDPPPVIDSRDLLANPR